MRKNLLGLLIASAVGAFTAHAQITWQTPVTISGASDVDTNGQYFASWAPYNGGASGLPVNGVAFQGYSDLNNGAGPNTTSLNSGYNAYGSAGTANANYNTLLEYATYANGGSATMNWGYMTPGGLYEIEFWAEDARGASGRSETVSDGINTSSSLNYSTLVSGHYRGAYVIGTFLADNTGSETLTLTADASAQVNLFQVRTLLATTPSVSPSTNVSAGTVMTIGSGITGGTPTSYQWQSNGVTIATTSNITFTATDPSNTDSVTNDYQVIVANSYGTMTSAVVVLTVNPAAPAMVVTNVPQPVTPLFQGDSVTLGYAVSGTPPVWVEWQLNGNPIGTFTNIGQATSVSLTLNGLQTNQAGVYTVIATNQFTTSITNSQGYTVAVEPYMQFSWFPPAPITTADAILDQLGSEIGAVDFGGVGIDVLLDNGSNIVFTGDASVASVTGGGTYSGFLNGNSISGNANFDLVLDGGDYDGGPKTITVFNLTPGNLYAVQLFALDDRGGDKDGDNVSITNRQVRFQDPNDPNSVSGTFTEGANNYVLGTFVANGTTQTITEQLPGITSETNNQDISSGNMNALVLYSLPQAATPWAALTAFPAQTNAAGVAVTLNESLATGIPPIYYQWQSNGVSVPGATNSSYTFTSVNTNNNLSISSTYTLAVSNNYGANTTSPITITTTPAAPPSFTTNVTQPPILFLGDNVTLVSGVAGTPPISLHWQLNGVNIPGATSSTLVLSALQAGQGGVYTLVASNAFGVMTNTPVTLTVEPFLQFAWSCPAPITTADATLGQNGTVLGAANFGGLGDTFVTLTNGSSIDFTGDGSVATTTGNGVTAGSYSDFSATTGNTPFDQVLSQFSYDGGPKTITLLNLTPGNLYAVQLFALDDRWNYLDSDPQNTEAIPERKVYFADPNDTNNTSQPYTEGANQYLLATFMANAPSQAITLQLPGIPAVVNSDAGNGNLNALVIYSLSNSATASLPPVASPASAVPVGTTVTLSDPSVTGLPPIYYQWQKNGVNIPGATNSVLVLPNVLASQAASYDLVVTNASGTNTSPALALNVVNEPVFTVDGSGWTLNGLALSSQYGQALIGSAPTMTNGLLTLTSGNTYAAESCFFDTPMYIGAFSASFTYQATGTAPIADGFTVCLQNSPYGPVVVGTTQDNSTIDGAQLGYGNIPNSAALAFNIYSGGTPGYALATNGDITSAGPPNGYAATGAVNLASGDPINIGITYNGNVITLSLVDATAATSFTTNITVGPLSGPNILASQTAYVGFTAAAGALTSVQTVTNFTFTPLVPLSANVTSAGTLAIAWPTGIGAYVLQTTANLGQSWTTVSPPYNTVNGQYQVTVSTTGKAFYRLQLSQ